MWLIVSMFTLVLNSKKIKITLKFGIQLKETVFWWSCFCFVFYFLWQQHPSFCLQPKTAKLQDLSFYIFPPNLVRLHGTVLSFWFWFVLHHAGPSAAAGQRFPPTAQWPNLRRGVSSWNNNSFRQPHYIWSHSEQQLSVREDSHSVRSCYSGKTGLWKLDLKDRE